jgi:hypothetical protein
MSDEKPMGQVIQIDEARIRDHLGEMVRGTVEETLNAMLDAEADQLCGAGRGDQGPRGEPYAQGYPCPGEPGRGRSQGASVTSAAKLGRIHGLAATSVRCRLVLAKLISRFRSCGALGGVDLNYLRATTNKKAASRRPFRSHLDVCLFRRPLAPCVLCASQAVPQRPRQYRTLAEPQAKASRWLSREPLGRKI